MEKRAYAIDICRTMALFLVLLYHSWVLTGSMAFFSSAVTLVVSLGGEIGVTAFFLLSGYGICFSIDSNKEKFKFKQFFLKRAERVVPQYYLSIIVALLFCDSAVYLSASGAKSIITHLLFIHNWFPECSGAINGALWTMGVIVQFYFVAYFLYRGIRRWGSMFAIGSIVFTIAMKAGMYAVILPQFGGAGSLEFFSGRQLLTGLDNFVIGMYVAWLVKNRKINMSQKFAYIGVICGIVLIYIICFFGMRTGIHTNNFSGYTWHSSLAIGIGIVLFFASYIHCNRDNVIVKALLWISKYEYGIYIWHLLMINNLLGKSEWIQGLLSSPYPKTVYLIFIMLSIGVGYMFSVMIGHFRPRYSDCEDARLG